MGEMMADETDTTEEQTQEGAAQQLMNEYFTHSHQAKDSAVEAYKEGTEIIACGWDNVAAQWAMTATLVAVHNELNQIKELMAAELHLKLPAEETTNGLEDTPETPD
jgi:hypothetical protein